MLSKQEKIDKRMKKMRETRKKNLANKGKKTYLNRNWLFSRRCIDRMSLDTIANLCKVEYDVIYFALKKFKIPFSMDIGSDALFDWIEKNKKKIAYREVSVGV